MNVCISRQTRTCCQTCNACCGGRSFEKCPEIVGGFGTPSLDSILPEICSQHESPSTLSGKGYKEVYICQALKAESHNYAYDMNSGLGWIKAVWFLLKQLWFQMLQSSFAQFDLPFDTGFLEDSCGDCGGTDEVREGFNFFFPSLAGDHHGVPRNVARCACSHASLISNQHHLPKDLRTDWCRLDSWPWAWLFK